MPIQRHTDISNAHFSHPSAVPERDVRTGSAVLRWVNWSHADESGREQLTLHWLATWTASCFLRFCWWRRQVRGSERVPYPFLKTLRMWRPKEDRRTGVRQIVVVEHTAGHLLRRGVCPTCLSGCDRHVCPRRTRRRAFIDDPNVKNKRRALIDRLLERDEFADYWSMKWGDILRIKAEFPVNLWPNAAQAYHRWIRASIAENKPYDKFVRELLTSSGSNFRVGPVNFYRAIQNKTPEGIANAVALAFMGARAENWPPDRLSGMAVFFSQIGYKPTSEWKEEIVFWDPLNASAVPGNSVPGTAKPGVSALAGQPTSPSRRRCRKPPTRHQSRRSFRMEPRFNCPRTRIPGRSSPIG